jgi:hypothetical protein
VHRDDEAVRSPRFGVVSADDPGERVGELGQAGGAISRCREPHLGIDPERGERLLGRAAPLMSAPVSRTSRAARVSSQRADS